MFSAEFISKPYCTMENKVPFKLRAASFNYGHNFGAPHDCFEYFFSVVIFQLHQITNIVI